jgi:sensor histidine kinase regulating citrate/malate metabolism
VRIVSSLKTKIILSVCAIVAFTIGIGTWINIGYQRGQIEHALEDNMLIIANTIDRSLANAMLQGESREVQSILESVGGYHNIVGVRIFSPNGVILKSSDRRKIGRTVEPAVQKLFLEGTFDRPIKRRSENVFTVLFPIKNREACWRCHGQTFTLNGVLAVDVSMLPVQQEVGQLSKTMILWAVGVTVVLAVSLSLFLARLSGPDPGLIATMERAEIAWNTGGDRSGDDRQAQRGL